MMYVIDIILFFLSFSPKTWHNTDNILKSLGGIHMVDYMLTVFSKEGESLLNESFAAQNDDEAKTIGQKRLDEEGYTEHTHRCVAPNARLVLFHR